MKQLVVVRHAKAEGSASDDTARALTRRGHNDARRRGEQLADFVTGTTRALVSPAVRTRETFEDLNVSLGIPPEHVGYPEGLYEASAHRVLHEVRTVDSESSTVLVVGHNPSMGDLVWMLHDGTHNGAWKAYGDRGFPTSAAAVLTYDGDWFDIDPRTMRLEDYLAPPPR
ncbi:SixA phosphatase family protein [Mumia zhuanghuii]|uniref:Histidine phosphatase family protein n=1 Tax=Mumia zhuanghuii TaxID=2585211 RepID=A0A5C4MJN5_9ACTN|nr:histidine phosphatase family protein [Mumia zhuanghuii]TNC45916.1 histidine phosphatase family protein [Mumia zhuanghuii]